MNREGRFMGFLKDQLSKVLILWYYYPVLKVYNTFIVWGKTFSLTTSNVCFDVSDTSSTFLCSFDLFLKSWFHYQGGKKSIRNNLKIELSKFLMKKWLILL